MWLIDRTICSLVGRVETALKDANVNFALRIVHNFVERIVTEPICTSQVFASHDLDQLCLAIGRHSLATLPFQQKSLPLGVQGGATIVYLVSRLQRSGGHSRLVQDFIRSQPSKNHLILSTEVGGPSDVDFYLKLFAKEENVRFIRAPGGNFEARLRWLQLTLLSTQPEHTYLFNHHQDSVAVAALVPDIDLVGSFCHHGDHHICLGVHLDHLNHIDLHPMGYHHCRNDLGIENQYLPLTFEDKGFPDGRAHETRTQGLVTATAAKSNKVEIPYYVSYMDLIPRVLKATGGYHIHIGKLTPWALRRMRSQMRKLGVDLNRLVYFEWTPSVWKSLQEHHVDLYLASFPYGAGLTLIEAQGAGIPVALHRHMFSRVLSGLELAYEEAFSWSNPDELLSYVSTLKVSRIQRESFLARAHFEKFHRSEITEHYLRDPGNPPPIAVPQLRADFEPRWDEWACWVEGHTSLKYLIYRFFYRCALKLRRFL